MAMLHTDYDVQIHLPKDKFNISVNDFPDDLAKVLLDTERVIKGRLSGVYSATTLASWSSPTATPEYIRAIGGRLAAAFLYSLRLAEDYPEEAAYARQKYNEGMGMLELVATGVATLPEVDEVVDTGGHLTAANYITGGEPKFAMSDEY
jgi:hypothetical protein